MGRSVGGIFAVCCRLIPYLLWLILCRQNILITLNILQILFIYLRSSQDIGYHDYTLVCDELAHKTEELDESIHRDSAIPIERSRAAFKIKQRTGLCSLRAGHHVNYVILKTCRTDTLQLCNKHIWYCYKWVAIFTLIGPKTHLYILTDPSTHIQT